MPSAALTISEIPFQGPVGAVRVGRIDGEFVLNPTYPQLADSDIDLLVEFEPGREPGLLGLAAMEAELTRLLGGKKVDLRTAQDLSRHIRDHVVSTAEVQYAG